MFKILLPLILIILPLYLIWKNDFKKNKIKKNKMKKTDFKFVDFFDEIRNHIRYVVGTDNIDYAGGVFVRHLMYHYINHKDSWLGKQIDCKYIQVRFQLKVYGDGQRKIYFSAESHYGDCRWDGKNMHYNYPIVFNNFECDIHEFPSTWIKFLEKVYSINPTDPKFSDRVRNGTMSYWTEKAYGHFLI